MFGIGLPEFILILILALIILGPRRIPDLARALGRGIAELQRMSDDLKRSLEEETYGEELHQDSESTRTTSQGISDPRPFQPKQGERVTPPSSEELS